jgi:DnaD/phage-associated family protein
MLRQKRIKNLRKRRTQLPEVMEYWAECRGMRNVPKYDQQFIHNFIEIYDATWIKAAIQIAARKDRQDYGKYVAGILRNWATNGAPDHISNPDQHLNSKKATPKQIDYIKALLNSIGLELKEFYYKDFDELTMLDAHNLIEELKNPVDSSGENT